MVLRLWRRARGHFVTLIEIGVHVITCSCSTKLCQSHLNRAHRLEGKRQRNLEHQVFLQEGEHLNSEQQNINTL